MTRFALERRIAELEATVTRQTERIDSFADRFAEVEQALDGCV